MGIDETGQNYATTEVELFRATRGWGRFDFLARADSEDLAAAQEEGSIFNYGEIGKRIASARSGAA